MGEGSIFLKLLLGSTLLLPIGLVLSRKFLWGGTLKNEYSKDEYRHEILKLILKTREEERKRISKELHDGLSPLLATAKLQLQRLAILQEDEGHPDQTQAISELLNILDVSLKDLRRLSHDLSGSQLEQLGLGEALRNYCRNIQKTTGIQLECVISSIRQLDSDTELSLFRIAQEALQNALKHSKARHLRVTLVEERKALLLQIEDDGVGFSRQSLQHSGIGLYNIERRSHLIGARLVLKSKPGQGCIVRITIRK